MSAFRYFTPYQTALDTAGVTLPGAKLYFYQSGTATPLATYSDDALSQSNTNPVEADAGGLFPAIFLQPSVDYKVILTDEDGNQLWEADPVTGGGLTVSTETVTNIAALKALSVTASLVGSVIFVLGYYTQGDGGEGLFLCTNNNPGSDNGGTIIWSNTTGFYYVRQTYGEPLSLKWFGAKGDGSTDDAVAIQAWLTAIPGGGAGYIPAVQSYYKFSAGLTRNLYFNITGDGVGSRTHYTGSGVALSLGTGNNDGPRFTTLKKFYLTGTSSATGGILAKEAQQGLILEDVLVDGFSGLLSYSLRLSASWNTQIRGGALKNSTYGLFCDDSAQTNSINVCNNISVVGCDMSGCTTGFLAKNGAVFNLIGCDFSSTVTAIDIATGTLSPDRVQVANILGNFMESTSFCVTIGKSAYGTGAAVKVVVDGNYMFGNSECVHIYYADSVYIGNLNVMNGTNTIDAPVTGTTWANDSNVTDNSAAGQTSYLRTNLGSIALPTMQVTTTGGFGLINQTTGAGGGAGTITNAPHAGNPDFWVPMKVGGILGWVPWWHA